MNKYRHHKYTWSKPFGSVRHNWELVGPRGAVNFHVTIPEPREGSAWHEPAAGLEFHHRKPPSPDRAPDQINCPLLGGWCWHDGTSLYASESVWPMVEPDLRIGDHESIFRTLEFEADRRFEQEPDDA